MARATQIAGIAAGVILGAGLIGGGAAFLGKAGAASTLNDLALKAAFEAPLDARTVEAATAIDATAGPVPDGRLLAASTTAHLLVAESAAPTAARARLEAARTRLSQEAAIAPASPYVWVRVAAIDHALGAAPADVAAKLRRSFTAGPNASAAWPARVALAFALWPDLDASLQARALEEATRMWRKAGDRHWDRTAMQTRLARMALDAGLTDLLTPRFSATPEEFARWQFLLGQEAARS